MRVIEDIEAVVTSALVHLLLNPPSVTPAARSAALAAGPY